MNVVIFGATGMVGQGVLRECLVAKDVEHVLSFGRRATGILDRKLSEKIGSNLANPAGEENQITDADACFFCLGVSSLGMTEADYRKITYDLTVSVAKQFVKLNPNMTFIYVTGQGTDSSEKGRVMWARVKGETENALLKLGFKAAYMFRPGYIHPLHGVRSPNRSYRAAHKLINPFHSWLQRALPQYFTTTEQMGLAMLKVAREGAPKAVLESRDINAL